MAGAPVAQLTKIIPTPTPQTAILLQRQHMFSANGDCGPIRILSNLLRLADYSFARLVVSVHYRNQIRHSVSKLAHPISSPAPYGSIFLKRNRKQYPSSYRGPISFVPDLNWPRMKYFDPVN